MSGFTDRTVQRALGASGRIQPRIAPITAPDPWVTPDPSELALERFEEVESQAPRPAADAVVGAPPRTPPPRSTTSEPLARRSATAPSTLEPAASQSFNEPAPAVASFRARELDIAARMRPSTSPALLASDPPGALDVDEEPTIASDPPHGSAAPSTPVRAQGEPPSRAAASPRSTSAARQPTTPTAARPPGSPELDVAELDAARRSSPSLEPAPARRGRRGAAEANDPVVRVHIGKVEVRAAPPPTPAPAAPRAPRPDAFVSLQQYLHKRGTS